MKTLEDFRQYFADYLSKELSTAESVRKQTIVRAVLVWVFAIPVTLLSVWGITQFMGQEHFWAVAILCGLVFGFLAYMLYREVLSSRRFYNLFKSRVIDGIIRFVDDRLYYLPHRAVPVAVFGRSGLFNKPVHRYEGDDYCVVQLENGTIVEFSEVHAHHKVKGNQGNREESVFEGLFAHVKLSNPRGGEIYIVPKGTSPEELGNKSTRFQSYPVENAAFSSVYEVYVNSPMTGKRCLTPELIEAFVSYHQHHPDLPLYYASHGHNIYVAMPRKSVLFEPDIWSSLVDVQSLEAFFKDLSDLWQILNKAVDLSGQPIMAQRAGESA